jgi:hypothetical protein
MRTAVEKLFELIDEIPFNSPEASDLYSEIMELKEQAKEMEKQQIIDAYNTSFLLRDKPYETADKYYNKTYKNKEE